MCVRWDFFQGSSCKASLPLPRLRGPLSVFFRGTFLSSVSSQARSAYSEFRALLHGAPAAAAPAAAVAAAPAAVLVLDQSLALFHVDRLRLLLGVALLLLALLMLLGSNSIDFFCPKKAQKAAQKVALYCI